MFNHKKIFKTLILFPPLLIIGCSTATHTAVYIKPNQAVVLDSTCAETITNQCSRDCFKIDSSWNPGIEDIRDMELNYWSLYELSKKNISAISDINRFYRQYAGIYYKGVKLIYINAMPVEENMCRNLDKEPCIICDGGTEYWGALYNPKTNKFSRLSFNGAAY